MKRNDIINLFIEKYNYKKYLEIGLSCGSNFRSINCAYKVSVDPDNKTNPTFKMTSDDFFSLNQDTFDVIFIDGLHHADQVYRDIENSIKILNTNGVIICHDMNPSDYKMQCVPRCQVEWTGDCWKAFVEFRMRNPDLETFVIDTDYGVGVIRRNNHKLMQNFNIDIELTYSNLEKNRKEWLNLINVNDFKGVFL